MLYGGLDMCVFNDFFDGFEQFAAAPCNAAGVKSKSDLAVRTDVFAFIASNFFRRYFCTLSEQKVIYDFADGI